MRTITLELLRHGPAHNQLLSPLTPYLALCENHGAVTVYMPFEHNQFLFRLRALEYTFQVEESRVFQISDTAQVVGDLLALIPGLTAESNKMEANDEQLTHLRLIISASELALLPFEMALSPNGFPGAGQHLLLQPQLPICLTREIRRVKDEKLEWPTKYRVLFVAASPPEVGTIPLESHLLTLRRVVEPWMKYFDKKNQEKLQEHISEHFVFLPNASIEAIEEKCASGSFTHVHILAHGVQREENFNSRFFLALHNAQNPQLTDYISGPRLATALRASNRIDGRGLARPMVVTLASCNSGGQGSVAGAGASLAHALHESGIPIVVAGQFPLSFKGSVRLVECLYEGLVWGKDPRWLLYDLRRRLFAQFPDTHDWASLTAYLSLPADFDQQLPRIQIKRASLSIDAAMNHADEISRIFSERIETEDKGLKGSNGELFKEAKDKIVAAKEKLEKLLDAYPENCARIHGQLASVEKRQAEILFCRDKADISPAEEGKKGDKSGIESTEGKWPADMVESFNLLCSARSHYWTAFQQDRSNSWALVQYLSLSLVLYKSEFFKTGKHQINVMEKDRPERKPEAIWSLARLLSEYDLHGTDRQRTAWAHANLLELNLLALLFADPGDSKADKKGNAVPHPDLPDLEEASNCTIEHAYSLMEIAGRDSFDVYATRRQIRRYVEWFNLIANAEGKPLKDPDFQSLANKIFEVFPKEVEDKFK